MTKRLNNKDDKKTIILIEELISYNILKKVEYEKDDAIFFTQTFGEMLEDVSDRRRGKIRWDDIPLILIREYHMRDKKAILEYSNLIYFAVTDIQMQQDRERHARRNKRGDRFDK